MTKTLNNLADLGQFYREQIEAPGFEAAFGEQNTMGQLSVHDEPMATEMPDPDAAQRSVGEPILWGQRTRKIGGTAHPCTRARSACQTLKSERGMEIQNHRWDQRPTPAIVTACGRDPARGSVKPACGRNRAW